MTPRLIAAALNADPIAGLTHGLGFGPEATPPEDGEDPYLVLCAAHAKVFRVEAETLRADLVDILAWSLNASHPDPAAPETRAALRTSGLYSEVLRKHIEDRRDVLKALDFPQHRSLVAALSAALKETS